MINEWETIGQLGVTTDNEFDKLKADWEGWKASIIIRRSAYLVAKEHLKISQSNLRDAKRVNKALTKIAKKKVKRIKVLRQLESGKPLLGSTGVG
jgi:hypothetical protein